MDQLYHPVSSTNIKDKCRKNTVFVLILFSLFLGKREDKQNVFPKKICLFFPVQTWLSYLVLYKYCGMFWLLVDSLQGWICCRGMEREEQIWKAMELEVYPFSYCFLRQHRHFCSWLCKHLHYSSVTCSAGVTGAN